MIFEITARSMSTDLVLLRAEYERARGHRDRDLLPCDVAVEDAAVPLVGLAVDLDPAVALDRLHRFEAAQTELVGDEVGQVDAALFARLLGRLVRLLRGARVALFSRHGSPW